MSEIDWPVLADLELLVAVAATGSLGAAARAVGIAQPNASRAVRKLERDLGVALVTRSPRGSRLTVEGDLVAEWAQAVLGPARGFAGAVASLRAASTARLVVSASRTVAEYALPAWLAALQQQRPQLQVRLTVVNSAEVLDHVRAGAAQLGFIESPGAPTGLRSTAVGTDRLVVVVAPAHPWARRRRPLLPAEVAATPLVVRERGSGTRATLERALAGLELAPPALELESNEAIRISVASGAGPAVLSELAVQSALAAGHLVVVPVDGMRAARRLRAVWSPTSPLRAAADLLRIAQSHGVGQPPRAGQSPAAPTRSSSRLS